MLSVYEQVFIQFLGEKYVTSPDCIPGLKLEFM